MIAAVLIIIIIMFFVGASSVERPAGPRTIGQKFCEGLVALICGAWGLGAGLGAVLGSIGFLLGVYLIIRGLFQ